MDDDPVAACEMCPSYLARSKAIPVGFGKYVCSKACDDAYMKKKIEYFQKLIQGDLL